MDESSKNPESQMAYGRAVDWVWEYAATNFIMGVNCPSGTSIPALVAIVGGMVPHLINVLYDGVDNANTKLITETVESFVIPPLLATLSANTLFASVAEDTIKLLNMSFSLPWSPYVYYLNASAGRVVSATTIAMGHIIIDIAEELLNGKITVENLQNKDTETIGVFKEQLNQYYNDALKQVKKDTRFSPDKFGAGKRTQFS